MMGFVYLLLCFGLGWAICSFALPEINKIVEYDYSKRKINVSPYLILFPSWYVVGTLAITWPTYLIALLFGNKQEPLLYANAIVIPISILILVLVCYIRYRKNHILLPSLICEDKKTFRIELILLAAITALACVLMWTTFFVRGNQLYVGISVFSDFSPHLGMIRSFSYGNNFPTTYSHYAGQDIRYHFMFQFLVGNLEYLGLRLDYAFNIPSILSFISAFLFLYLLAVKITGKIGAGILACMFFAFRSAKTLFTYLANLPEGTSIIKALSDNMDFISDTPNENWGLWNLNVYCNQRHLAFGLSVMFLILILFMPYLFTMFETIKCEMDHSGRTRLERFIVGIKTIFFTKEAWVTADIRKAIASGIILGSLACFHGAAVICCLIILFFIAVLSKHRLDFLITAVIALFLSTLQTHLFIHGSVVSTKLLFGFIAETKTFFGVLSYLDRLLGVLPFVLLAAFCLEKGVGRYLIIAFTAPLVFAVTISLTVDVTVNHKYIMMSCILLGIFAASVLMKMLERKDFLIKCIGVLLILMLTATGIYDFATVLKKNTPQSAIKLNLEDPLTKWIDENSDSEDLFLTAHYALNQIVLGGAMLYEGWPYFPWSAGYDTEYRTEQVKLMYEANSSAELKGLIEKNKIRFIVVDHDVRTSDSYTVKEDIIAATYECVYRDGDGDYTTFIYDTKKPRT